MCRELGPPDVVRVEDVPATEVGPGQVRVRIGAAAVNFPDVLIVAGTYQMKVPPPFVPGSEFAGVVAEVGADVTGVALGDVVAGTGIVGAFAQEAVVPASSVWRVPEGVDVAAAAAFGVAHRTAYHVLRSVAGASPGDEVVVLGAGGGVGLAAVQLAVQLGATVTAVASSQEKLDVAASCGATRFVNHREGDLRTALKDALPGGADVVVDPVGGSLSVPSYRSMRWGGRFVTVGFAAGIPELPLNLVLLKGAAVLGFQFIDFATHRPDEVARNEAELMALLAAGKASPHIGATFPLDQVVDALRYVAEGSAIGKVVVSI